MLGLKHVVRHGGALRLESMRYARHECTECAEIRHAGRQSGARRSSVRGDLRDAGMGHTTHGAGKGVCAAWVMRLNAREK